MIEILRDDGIHSFRTRIGSVTKRGILVGQTHSTGTGEGGPVRSSNVYLTYEELSAVMDAYLNKAEKVQVLQDVQQDQDIQ